MIRGRQGTTLIDLVMSMAIVAMLFGGVYLVYFSIETAVANISVRSAATTAINNEIETVRNLPYASVGTVSGIPSGVIPQTQSVSEGNFTFTLQTTVLNIFDTFDSSPSSTPVADYKLVDITASCPLCNNFVPIEITTTVAPSLLGQGTNYGSIFIYTLDANGLPVPNANVRVVNASVTPSIDLTDTANASGVLKLIGVPSSTQGYQIFVSKTGYTSAQTYPQGVLSNPNPVQPNITVASQTVSSVTFGIDRVSTLTVQTVNNQCVAVSNKSFSIQGGKLIGTTPNILKYSTSTHTNASGTITLNNVEWDTYSLSLNDAVHDLAGTMPFSPITVDPNTANTFQFILQPAADPALLVTVEDAATGATIPEATVTLTKTGFSQSLTTNHAIVSQSDWSSNQYSSISAGVDPATPGILALLINASGTYDTSSTAWLVSPTFDVGGASSSFNALTWSPIAQPTSTLIQFQVAANNDNTTWSFVGPNGATNTFFTTSSSLPASLAGNRYFRYKVYLSTQDSSVTPRINSASFDFTGKCVPISQVLFTSLPQANFTASISAANYASETTTVSIAGGWQSTTVQLSHL